MSEDKGDKVFAVVFTSCLLGVEFITTWWWWTRRAELLWWLLLPAAVGVGIVILFRFLNQRHTKP